MDLQALYDLGLTPVESKIYLTLLELGSASANDVARKSGIHRRSVYDAMERLIEKGLIAYIKRNNRRLYQAAEPERLLGLLDEHKKGVETILPELQVRYSHSREKQETLFYKGKNGLRTIFDDQIRVGKEVLVIGGHLGASEIIKAYFPKYTNMRKEKKVQLRIIYSGGNKRKEEIPLSDVRYLPEGYGSLASTNIYGDKVAIIMWTDDPMGVLINNKEVAKAYREYFELLWKLAKK
jgi:sugar-specific transcriptional regulator TrmB